MRGDFTDLMDRAPGIAGFNHLSRGNGPRQRVADRLSFQAAPVPAAGMESGGESTGSMTRPPTVIQTGGPAGRKSTSGPMRARTATSCERTNSCSSHGTP